MMMSGYTSLKEVFDRHFEKTKFDAKMAKSLYQYQIWYVNKSQEHLEFFGGNLLGVQVVRFKDSDVARFYNEVIDVDYIELIKDIRKVDTIDHSFKVGGDVLNLTMMYVIHRCLVSDSLSDSQKHRAAYDSALIFFYRCISAIQSYNFRYPADPKVAQMAYANLSNKFLIKKLGSWHKVMDYRSEDLVSKGSIHHKSLTEFTDDTQVVYAIADSQGRVRDLYKNYYAEFAKVRAEGSSVAVTSGTWIDAEGEETIKEKTKSSEAYVQYMRQAVVDKPTFVKDELISIVVKINNNTSFRMVKSTLNWMCDRYNDSKHHKKIDELVSTTVIQSLYLMDQHLDNKSSRDYPHILVTLKNLYLSTRTSDPQIDKIRDLGYQIVRSANGRVSESLTLSTRTTVILYLTLRALVGQNTRSS